MKASTYDWKLKKKSRNLVWGPWAKFLFVSFFSQSAISKLKWSSWVLIIFYKQLTAASQGKQTLKM